MLSRVDVIIYKGLKGLVSSIKKLGVIITYALKVLTFYPSRVH
jgi:hypothetical protein